MRPRTDDEILEDLKDWPVRNIYVERGVKLIEQLRQRVQELETLNRLSTSLSDRQEKQLKEQFDVINYDHPAAMDKLRQRVAELEENWRLSERASAKRQMNVIKLTAECDHWKQVAQNNHDRFVDVQVELEQLRQRVQELEKELEYFESDIDTCTQHNVELQLEVIKLTAERDELLKAVAIAKPVMEAHSGPSRLADFLKAIDIK